MDWNQFMQGVFGEMSDKELAQHQLNFAGIDEQARMAANNGDHQHDSLGASAATVASDLQKMIQKRQS